MSTVDDDKGKWSLSQTPALTSLSPLTDCKPTSPSPTTTLQDSHRTRHLQTFLALFLLVPQRPKYTHIHSSLFRQHSNGLLTPLCPDSEQAWEHLFTSLCNTPKAHSPQCVTKTNVHFLGGKQTSGGPTFPNFLLMYSVTPSLSSTYI